MEKSRENRPLIESFENRRHYPRLNLDLPVAITNSGGEILNADIYNISPDGIQIRYKVNDGVDIFRDLTSSEEDFSIVNCNLEFDLEYPDKVDHIKIDAFPLYIDPVDNEEMACGMLFSDKELPENKKISDFLFFQLQASFAELEYATENSDQPVISARSTVVEGPGTSSISEEIKGISQELDELILLMDNSNTDTEPMRQILLQLLNRLRSNQETLRLIDERISRIQKDLTGN